MNKRWLLFLSIYLICISSISYGIDFSYSVVSQKGASYETLSNQNLDTYRLSNSESFPDEARRVRSTNNSHSRQKIDQSLVREESGIVFFICKLTISYSELFIDKYLRHLIGQTIQVNAP